MIVLSFGQPLVKFWRRCLVFLLGADRLRLENEEHDRICLTLTNIARVRIGVVRCFGFRVVENLQAHTSIIADHARLEAISFLEFNIEVQEEPLCSDVPFDVVGVSAQEVPQIIALID